MNSRTSVLCMYLVNSRNFLKSSKLTIDHLKVEKLERNFDDLRITRSVDHASNYRY